MHLLHLARDTQNIPFLMNFNVETCVTTSPHSLKVPSVNPDVHYFPDAAKLTYSAQSELPDKTPSSRAGSSSPEHKSLHF